MRTKRELDSRIAELTGQSLSQASATTSLFIRLLSQSLAKGRRVDLTGFGTFSVRVYETKDNPLPQDVKFHVHVKKSATLARVLRRYYVPKGSIMEKYGVDEGRQSNQLEKAASEGCPKCGAKVSRQGRTLLCPRCGTEPFESSSK